MTSLTLTQPHPTVLASGLGLEAYNSAEQHQPLALRSAPSASASASAGAAAGAGASGLEHFPSHEALDRVVRAHVTAVALQHANQHKTDSELLALASATGAGAAAATSAAAATKVWTAQERKVLAERLRCFQLLHSVNVLCCAVLCCAVLWLCCGCAHVTVCTGGVAHAHRSGGFGRQ